MWHHHLPNRKDILHARVRQASISRQGQRKMAWRRVCDVFHVRLNADRYKGCKIISVNIFSAFQSCSILVMCQFIPWKLMLAELWRLLVSFQPTQKLSHIQGHNRHSNLKRQMCFLSFPVTVLKPGLSRVSVRCCVSTSTGLLPHALRAELPACWKRRRSPKHRRRREHDPTSCSDTWSCSHNWYRHFSSLSINHYQAVTRYL